MNDILQTLLLCLTLFLAVACQSPMGKGEGSAPPTQTPTEVPAEVPRAAPPAECPTAAPLPAATPSSTALAQAIALAEAAIAQEADFATQRYTITRVEQIVREGRYLWIVTFKPTHLLPADPAQELIGAGGELLVSVDVAAETTVIRYGE